MVRGFLWDLDLMKGLVGGRGCVYRGMRGWCTRVHRRGSSGMKVRARRLVYASGTVGGGAVGESRAA